MQWDFNKNEKPDKINVINICLMVIYKISDINIQKAQRSLILTSIFLLRNCIDRRFYLRFGMDYGLRFFIYGQG